MSFLRRYVFDYDFRKGEVIHECTVNPTEITKDETFWIYASNNKYDDENGEDRVDPEKVGKWMLFLSKGEVNSVWNKIKQAIKDGHLWHSKVSTSEASNPTHAIMIYTKDYTDLDDVISVLEVLETYEIKSPNKIIRYKTDQQTRAGVYSKGGQKASIYDSNTIRHLKK